MNYRRQIRRGVGMSVMALMTAVATLIVTTPAAPTTEAQTSDAPVSSAQAGVTVAAPRMWTKAEMDAAQPMPVRTKSGTRTAGTASAPSGSPQTRDGALPSGQVAASSGAVVPMVSTAPQQTGVYPSPFTRWEWFGRYRTFPQSAAGVKMFFTQNGGNFVCSASVARPGALNTAGHCVHAGNNSATGWSTNVLVCPSYDSAQGGVNPQVGCWTADALWAGGAWFSTGDLDRDFGAIDAANTGGQGACAGLAIHSCTGFLGLTWNQSRDQHWIAEGYPQGSPFTGGKLITVAGEYWATENGGPGLDSSSMGNDMTGGSSGGPWIVGFGNFSAANRLNGHNDWRWSNLPLEMNSPYYDDTWAAVLRAACGNCF